MTRCCLTSFVAVLCALPLVAEDKPKESPILCRGNYHSEADAIQQLARMAATYSNLAEWKTRAEKVRKQILVGANLYPLPERTPLNPIIHKKREYADSYSV